MSVALRDYQHSCLRAIADRWLEGVRRQLVCLPTGSGKTVIFSQFPRYFKMKKQMLVLAHREELLEQARDKILRANPSLKVGIEQADRRAEGTDDVVVASVQTLGRAGSERLERLDPERFYLLVVDEAHHATADTYRRILQYFGVFEKDTRKLLVGFTATPRRGDGQGLDAIFQEIVYSRTLPEMIVAGYLAPVSGRRIETAVDLSRVKTRLGDYVVSQLSETVNVDERNNLLVEVYREYLSQRPTLLFCVDVAHAHQVAQTFAAAGVPTAAVTGELPRAERASLLEDFASGRLKCLANCMVLTEGYDEPTVAGILLARPTKSTLLYTQMIGRGTRLSPGKRDVLIVDVVDATSQHKLVTLPSLFGLSGHFNLEGHTVAEVQRAMAWVEQERPWVRVGEAESLSDLRYRCQHIDLWDLVTPDEIAHCTRFAWVGLGTGAYRLGLKDGRRLSVSMNILGQLEVTLREMESERVVFRCLELPQALRRAEDYVEAHYPEDVALVMRETRWRFAAATEKQLEVLRQRKIQVPDGLTRGQASHLISMLRNA